LRQWLLVLTGIPATTGIVAEPGKVGREPMIYRSPAFWLIGLRMALALNVALILGICYPPHFINSGYTVAIARRAGRVNKSVTRALPPCSRPA
jgi:hypothetical protein